MQTYLCIRSALPKNLVFKILRQCVPEKFIKHGCLSGNLFFIKKTETTEREFAKYAIKGGHPNVLSYFVKKYPNFKFNPIIAMKKDYYAGFKWLLHNTSNKIVDFDNPPYFSYDPNEKSEENYLLNFAIFFGRLAFIKLIIRKYPNIRINCDSFVYLAIKDFAIYKFLFKNKVFVGLNLHSIIKTNNEYVLLLHYADSEIERDREIILKIAAENNCDNILEYLYYDEYKISYEIFKNCILDENYKTIIFFQEKQSWRTSFLAIKFLGHCIVRKIYFGVSYFGKFIPRFNIAP